MLLLLLLPAIVYLPIVNWATELSALLFLSTSTLHLNLLYPFWLWLPPPKETGQCRDLDKVCDHISVFNWLKPTEPRVQPTVYPPNQVCRVDWGIWVWRAVLFGFQMLKFMAKGQIISANSRSLRCYQTRAIDTPWPPWCNMVSILSYKCSFCLGDRVKHFLVGQESAVIESELSLGNLPHLIILKVHLSFAPP